MTELQLRFLELRAVEQLDAKLVVNHANPRLDLLVIRKHFQRMVIVCKRLKKCQIRISRPMRGFGSGLLHVTYRLEII